VKVSVLVEISDVQKDLHLEHLGVEIYQLSTFVPRHLCY